MNKKIIFSKRGVTLIELMVSILIIALLTTIGLVVMRNSRVKARDAKRVYDLQQYAKALRLYVQSDPLGAYPSSAGYLGKNHPENQTNNDLKPYIPDLPSDPRDPGGGETGNYFYYYIPNNTCLGGIYPTIHVLNMETSNPDYYHNDCIDGSSEQGADRADYLIIVY
jgi:prepilin-type N-terminal cleavage/methylation domain-containing protein